MIQNILKTKNNNIPIIILAGGKSRRMGTDKALLPFRDFNTLVEFQYHKFKDFFDEVFISWKNEKVSFGAKSIFDAKSEISAPILALSTIFHKLKSKYIIVVSVDTPFFGINEIEKLLKAIENNDYDAVIPKTENGIEPLTAIYNRSILKKIDDMVDKKNYKLKTLIENIKPIFVEFKEQKPFTNLNYFKEYHSLKEVF